MARRYGNAGNLSSLISSARSAYEKQQSLQDQIEAYNWDLSEKSPDDAQKYINYLNGRAKSYEGIDQSKQITLQQKANSANRAFVSAETSRLSNSVIEGNMSNTQKYRQLEGLYQQAMQNGDENLAQRLYGTLDRLSVTIQNEASAAAGRASAAASAGYTATKKGITAKIDPIDRGLKILEEALRNKEIGTTEYMTKKRQLLIGKKNVLDTVAPRDDNSPTGVGNPYGLKEEDLMSFAQKNGDLYKGENAKFLGQAGNYIDQGASPFKASINPLTGQVDLKDRKMIGQSYTGPQFADNITGEMDSKYKKGWEKLGFKSGAGAGGMNITLPDGREVRAFIDNPDNPSMAVFQDGGLIYQVTPDRKVGIVSQTPGGQFVSDLMGEQAKISKKVATEQFDKQLGGLAGVLRVPGQAIIDKGEEFVDASSKVVGEMGKFVSKQVGGNSIVQGAGDTLNKIARISGMQKLLEEKKARDAAEQARVLAANRAEAARQQASYQAQLQQSSVPAAPGKQLYYDWKTNTVQNKLSPVFKDPLSKDPNMRAVQVVRGGLGSNSIYNKLR